MIVVKYVQVVRLLFMRQEFINITTGNEISSEVKKKRRKKTKTLQLFLSSFFFFWPPVFIFLALSADCSPDFLKSVFVLFHLQTGVKIF